MNFGVVVFPGSNCDDDMIHVLGSVMGQHVQKIWHKDHIDLKAANIDCIILPGGFSFGDYLRSGAVARLSPVMDDVIKFANQGGLVFGICNGFQILCETGLLPGVLLRNKEQKFICKNVHLKTITSNSMITSKIDEGAVLKIPIAHAEGRFFARENVLDELQQQDQILFKYCDADGNISDESNINGSSDNIAGITNAGRNVFGMMPHPERASESVLGNTDGKVMFESLIESAITA